MGDIGFVFKGFDSREATETGHEDVEHDQPSGLAGLVNAIEPFMGATDRFDAHPIGRKRVRQLFANRIAIDRLVIDDQNRLLNHSQTPGPYRTGLPLRTYTCLYRIHFRPDWLIFSAYELFFGLCHRGLSWRMAGGWGPLADFWEKSR